MGPLLRRTWAERGRTPPLVQRGRHREKVSICGALWWAPWSRRPLGLHHETLVDAYYNNGRTAEFLGRLLRKLPGRLLVVWDGSPIHRRARVKAFVAATHSKVRLEALPGYAPDLIPSDQEAGIT